MAHLSHVLFIGVICQLFVYQGHLSADLWGHVNIRFLRLEVKFVSRVGHCQLFVYGGAICQLFVYCGHLSAVSLLWSFVTVFSCLEKRQNIFSVLRNEAKMFFMRLKKTL